VKGVAAEPYRDIDFSGAKRGPVIPGEPGETKTSIRSDSAVIEYFRARVERARTGNIHMHSLELKVPPPLVALVLAAAMWVIAKMASPIEAPDLVRHVVAAVIALAGGCVSLAGIVAFRRARTTVNPLKPQNTSALVTAGIYKYTRNPMYLGLLLVLLAWAVFLSSVWALAGPFAFVLYIGRFQIAPEERVLATMFGAGYADYRATVRRWL
jgi:protein-S-isoprenylcysteine O-methyltransferase Ste14